jgi:hypothetical protein
MEEKIALNELPKEYHLKLICDFADIGYDTPFFNKESVERIFSLSSNDKYSNIGKTLMNLIQMLQNY